LLDVSGILNVSVEALESLQSCPIRHIFGERRNHRFASLADADVQLPQLTIKLLKLALE